MSLDPTAAVGFEQGAEAYQRGRPGYPDEAAALLAAELGIGPGTRVCDLAAGTGKFTRLLLDLGADVVAVEPVAAMRHQLVATLGGVEVLDGTAEAVPLGDGSVAVVTVAQAFHWFDHQAALAEIARVLGPGGGLALVWNRRDERVEWVRAMSDVLDWHARTQSSYERRDWAPVVAAAGRFTPLRHATLPYVQAMTREVLEERVRSVSFVAASAEPEREALVARVLALVEGADEPFPLPYVTSVWWCRRIG